MSALLIMINLMLVAILVYANVEYRRKLAKMTPTERAEFEEEVDREMRIW